MNLESILKTRKTLLLSTILASSVSAGYLPPTPERAKIDLESAIDLGVAVAPGAQWRALPTLTSVDKISIVQALNNDARGDTPFVPTMYTFDGLTHDSQGRMVTKPFMIEVSKIQLNEEGTIATYTLNDSRNGTIEKDVWINPRVRALREQENMENILQWLGTNTVEAMIAYENPSSIWAKRAYNSILQNMLMHSDLYPDEPIPDYYKILLEAPLGNYESLLFKVSADYTKAFMHLQNGYGDWEEFINGDYLQLAKEDRGNIRFLQQYLKNYLLVDTREMAATMYTNLASGKIQQSTLSDAVHSFIARDFRKTLIGNIAHIAQHYFDRNEWQKFADSQSVPLTNEVEPSRIVADALNVLRIPWASLRTPLDTFVTNNRNMNKDFIDRLTQYFNDMGLTRENLLKGAFSRYLINDYFNRDHENPIQLFRKLMAVTENGKTIEELGKYKEAYSHVLANTFQTNSVRTVISRQKLDDMLTSLQAKHKEVADWDSKVNMYAAMARGKEEQRDKGLGKTLLGGLTMCIAPLTGPAAPFVFAGGAVLAGDGVAQAGLSELSAGQLWTKRNDARGERNRLSHLYQFPISIVNNAQNIKDMKVVSVDIDENTMYYIDSPARDEADSTILYPCVVELSLHGETHPYFTYIGNNSLDDTLYQFMDGQDVVSITMRSEDSSNPGKYGRRPFMTGFENAKTISEITAIEEQFLMSIGQMVTNGVDYFIPDLPRYLKTGELPGGIEEWPKQQLESIRQLYLSMPQKPENIIIPPPDGLTHAITKYFHIVRENIKVSE